MPKIKITRHHSNGDATILSDAMYPGVMFDMKSGFSVFIELEDNPTNLVALGIAYDPSENAWNVVSTHPTIHRTEVFKEMVYKPGNI